MLQLCDYSMWWEATPYAIWDVISKIGPIVPVKVWTRLTNLEDPGEDPSSRNVLERFGGRGSRRCHERLVRWVRLRLRSPRLHQRFTSHADGHFDYGKERKWIKLFIQLRIHQERKYRQATLWGGVSWILHHLFLQNISMGRETSEAPRLDVLLFMPSQNSKSGFIRNNDP